MINNMNCTCEKEKCLTEGCTCTNCECKFKETSSVED